VWAHLLPAAKRPPTLPALEHLLLVPGAPDADGSLDACQQQVRRLLQMSCSGRQMSCGARQTVARIARIADQCCRQRKFQLTTNSRKTRRQFTCHATINAGMLPFTPHAFYFDAGGGTAQHAAAVGRRPWGESPDGRLRALPAELNALDMRLGTLPTAAAAFPAAASSSAAAAAAPEDTAAGSASAPQGSTSAAQQLAMMSAAAAGVACSEAGAGAEAAAGPVPAHAADEPPGHRSQAAGGDPRQQDTTTRDAEAVTALRRASRQCATLAKDLAAGQHVLCAAKRD
jgi:hypothetical protein